MPAFCNMRKRRMATVQWVLGLQSCNVELGMELQLTCFRWCVSYISVDHGSSSHLSWILITFVPHSLECIALICQSWCFLVMIHFFQNLTFATLMHCHNSNFLPAIFLWNEKCAVLLNDTGFLHYGFYRWMFQRSVMFSAAAAFFALSSCIWHNPKIGENQKWKFSFSTENNSMSTSFGKNLVTL